MNDGRKNDSGKERLDLVPPRALLAMGRVLTHGARIYAPNNWLKVEGGKPRYFAAALRHCFKYACGEEYDPDSGEHHLAHAMTDISFVLELELLDRAPRQAAPIGDSGRDT